MQSYIKRSGGRPRKEEEEKQIYSVTVRFNERDYCKVDDIAYKAGITMAELGRKSMLRQRIIPRISPEELALYKEVCKDMTEIGKNINQLAKLANSNVTRDHTGDYLEAMKHLTYLRDMIKTKLL